MWNAGKPRVGAAEASLRPVRSSQEEASLDRTIVVSVPSVALTRPAELLLSTPILTDPSIQSPYDDSLGTSRPGPNPYGAFQRRFTEEGGIAFTFLAKDDGLWWWWLRFGLWVTLDGIELFWRIDTYIDGYTPVSAVDPLDPEASRVLTLMRADEW